MRNWQASLLVVSIGAAVFGVVHSFSEFKAPSEMLSRAETVLALPTGLWWAVLAVCLGYLVFAGFILTKKL